MIKYFCDFCKNEITTTTKPVKEVGITISALNATTNSRSTIKVDHICNECNELLMTDLKTRGLEVF